MKDEIKEIINQLEIVARKHTIEVYEDGSKIETMPASVVDELRLNNYSSKILLDYITNLQEEIHKKEAMYDSLAVDYRLSQEENDILKRDIEAMKHNYNLLVRCIENGESMTQKFENGLTYQDYKSRNEKAIEYIHNHQPVFELSNKEQIQEWFEKEYYIELLNILNGGDEE